MGLLTNLVEHFHSYFPDMEEKSKQLDWVRNPFHLSETNGSNLPVNYQETLLEVSSDRGLQIKFATSTLTQFWVCVKQEHPDLGQKASEQLLPFASTYLCEASFCNDCDKNKAEKQTVPGQKLDHSSCLPATKTDKASQ